MIPRGTFSAIAADPPWSFATWGPKGQGRGAVQHYGVMTLDDIAALPVRDYAADDCVLFLWAINPMLPQALRVMESWGFSYRTKAFEWVKLTPRSGADALRWHMGLGYYTRQNSESCLLGVRGKPKRLNRDVRQLLVAPRREHSRKPDEFYSRVERLVPGPYLELFARQSRPGWATWGAEREKFDGAGIVRRALRVENI